MSLYPVRFSIVLAALAVAAASGSAASAAEPNFTGTWGSYPGFRGPPPDAKLVPPPPTPMLLKEKYKGAYEAMRAKQVESDKRGEPLSNASTQCLPNGMPQMMSAIYPVEFIQSPGQLTVIAEAMSQVRRVYLNKPQAKIEEVPPGYYGHSVGHWEGDTLVVDTIAVKEDVLGFKDMPHSDQMHIRERLHLVAPDILHDQITIEDPVVLEKPFTYTVGFRRMPAYEMLEYVCENNRDYVDQNGVTRMRLQPK